MSRANRVRPFLLVAIAGVCAAALTQTAAAAPDLLQPSQSFSGLMGSGGAPPALDTTIHGSSGYRIKPTGDLDEPRDMWIEPDCDGTCTGNNYTVAVMAGTADRAQIDHVDFYLEGSKVTVSTPSINPRTKSFGYVVNLASGSATAGPGGGAGCNGEALLTWDIVPVNGLVRRGSRHFTLNTQTVANTGCAAGYQSARIQPPLYYVDNAGSDVTGGGMGKGSAAFATIGYAEKTVPPGSTVTVTSGQTFVEDAVNDAKYYPAEGSPCRMVRFNPSISGQPYTITRSDRYLNKGSLRISTCSAEFKSATFDMSKIGQIDAAVANNTTVFSDVAFVDPLGPDGPDIMSSACTQVSASQRCLYGPADQTSTLFGNGTGHFWAVIDSSRTTKTKELTGADFTRNWYGAQTALDINSNFVGVATGWPRYHTVVNATAAAVTGDYQGGTTTLPQNLKVTGIATCSSAVTLPSNVTIKSKPVIANAGSTFIEATRTETSFTGSISGKVLNVSGTVLNGPIFPGMILTGNGVLSGTAVASSRGSNQWNLTAPNSADQTVASTTISTAPPETFGLGLRANNQYMVFGNNKGSLVDGGMMLLTYASVAPADFVGPAGDGSCAGKTLARANHIYFVSDCGAGQGRRGACEPSPDKAKTLTIDASKQPVMQGATADIAKVALGQTILTFQMGHSDLGQMGILNSANLNWDNFLFQNVDWRGVYSQPFLFQPGGLRDTMTARQSGTAFTVDALTVGSLSFDGTDSIIMWSGSPPTGGYEAAQAIGEIGGILTNGSARVEMDGGCTSRCQIRSGTRSYTNCFSCQFAPGDRIAMSGQPGVWRIDEVVSDYTMIATSLGGLTSISKSDATPSKVGAAVHFTSGDLAGQEFPLAQTTVNASTGKNDAIEQPAGGSAIVGDVTGTQQSQSPKAKAGDTAYINPGFELGDFVRWVDCKPVNGSTTPNYSYVAIVSLPAGDRATMSRSSTCGAGSSYQTVKSVMGATYMGVNLATNANQVEEFDELGQLGPGGMIGLAFLGSTVHGAQTTFRNGTDQKGFGIDYSAALDSVFYNSPLSTQAEAFGQDTGGTFPSNPQMNFDTNAFLGKTAQGYGASNQALVWSNVKFDTGVTFDHTYKPNVGGTTGLTRVQKGVQGNPNRTAGCPIYPYDQGTALVCGSAKVGARQP